MTKLGEGYTGVWPEYPILNVRPGDVVRYPVPGTGKGIITRGVVKYVGGELVVFADNSWCYKWQVSEDKD